MFKIDSPLLWQLPYLGLSCSSCRAQYLGCREVGSKSNQQPQEHNIFETQEIEIDGICGTLEETKEDFEVSVLDCFEEEFDNCGNERGVQSINLVQWEQALSFTEYGNPL